METRTCPFCKEEININAIKCKHCGEFITDEKIDRKAIQLKPFNYNIGISIGILNFITGIVIMLIIGSSSTQKAYLFGLFIWFSNYSATIYLFNKHINNFEIKSITKIIKTSILSFILSIISLLVLSFEEYSESIMILFLAIALISFITFIISFFTFSIKFIKNKFDLIGGINVVGLCNLIFVIIFLLIIILKLFMTENYLEKFQIILFITQIPIIGILYTFFKAKNYSKLNSESTIQHIPHKITNKKSKNKLIISLTLTVFLILIGAFAFNWNSIITENQKYNNGIAKDPKSQNSNTNSEYREANVRSDLKNNNVVCTEKEEKIQNSEDPRIIYTCIWRNFKTIRTGHADFKGRYEFSYQLYKYSNNNYIEVNNSELFNNSKTELLEKINRKIKSEFEDYSKDPENQGCFDEISLPYFTFEDLDLFFMEKGILFNASFGLSGPCLSVDGTSFMFEWYEIEKYINDL